MTEWCEIMGKDNGTAKILAILGGLIGFLSVFIYFADPTLGAWWQLEGVIYKHYISALGTAEVDDFTMHLGVLGFIAGVLFILGSLLIFVAAGKESKGIASLSFILMIGAFILYGYSLTEAESLQILSGTIDIINSISQSNEYNMFFGELGFWSWRLGNGFFIAIGAAVLTLIAAMKIH